MTEPLTAYEERLLGELTAVVSARAADAPAPIPLPNRRRRLVPIAAALGTVAAGATALTALTLAGGGTPAYAVERLPNGVGITINDADHLAGLDQQLRDAGLNATVVPIRQGCPDPRAELIGDRHQGYNVEITVADSGALHVDITGPPLPAGETAYLGVLQRKLPNGQTAMRLEAEISSRHRTCFPAIPGDEQFPAQH